MRRDDKIYINSVEVVLHQDGNTLGTTDDVEVLTIRLETQIPDDPFDPFAVIKTDGWSVGSGKEIAVLIDLLVSQLSEFQRKANAMRGEE